MSFKVPLEDGNVDFLLHHSTRTGIHSRVMSLNCRNRPYSAVLIQSKIVLQIQIGPSKTCTLHTSRFCCAWWDNVGRDEWMWRDLNGGGFLVTWILSVTWVVAVTGEITCLEVTAICAPIASTLTSPTVVRDAPRHVVLNSVQKWTDTRRECEWVVLSRDVKSAAVWVVQSMGVLEIRGSSSG